MEELIDQIKKECQKDTNIAFCYLFGSFASGKTNRESDIDIAIYLDQNTTKDFFNKRLDLIARLTQLLHREVDIIILNTAYPFLRYVIIKEGKLIYSKDEDKRIDFELKTLNDYYDFKPTMEQYNQVLINI